MDNEPVRRLYAQPNAEGQPGELVRRRETAPAVQRGAALGASRPLAVSQSSYLNEMDRHFRAAETVENGQDLAERSVTGVLRLDERLRKAQTEGASPHALALIQRIEWTLGNGTALLVDDFLNRPYERW